MKLRKFAKTVKCLIKGHHYCSKEIEYYADKKLRLYGLGIKKLDTVSKVNEAEGCKFILSCCLRCGKKIKNYSYWSGDSWLVIRDYLSTHPHLKYDQENNRYSSTLWNGDPYAIELAIIQGNKP